MTRHVIDQPRRRADAMRVRHFLNLERAQNPDRAALMLQRRMRKGQASPRVREFLRIERGYMA
ncbi:hypothetical protein [Histidinibacterium lentulum]|uniref:Uncharacterized protein n=1 Tax=Histidinibacterium lentulum TaxID=2480588 RepID=A0A3N2R1B5_9RHOB|nr:hypothetical protein [Histidinibacterium lentulum]ROU01271.1 hypothetical protein EAT49_12215 [Histidinibacterium lentulum]